MASIAANSTYKADFESKRRVLELILEAKKSVAANANVMISMKNEELKIGWTLCDFLGMIDDTCGAPKWTPDKILDATFITSAGRVALFPVFPVKKYNKILEAMSQDYRENSNLRSVQFWALAHSSTGAFIGVVRSSEVAACRNPDAF